MLPIIRFTVQMHHRQNEQAFGIFGVHDAKGKTADQGSADFSIQASPSQGKGFRALDGSAYLDGKIVAKAGFERFIVLDGIQEFSFSFDEILICELVEQQ